MNTNWKNPFINADGFGIDTTPANAVSDLQGLMTFAWAIMNDRQRQQLLQVLDVEQMNAISSLQEKSLPELIGCLHADLARKTIAIENAGYLIMEDNRGFHWFKENQVRSGEDCKYHSEAVESAYKDLKNNE